MAESKLRTLSIDFAVQILNLVKFLKNQHETIVSNQIGRFVLSVFFLKKLPIIAKIPDYGLQKTARRGILHRMVVA